MEIIDEHYPVIRDNMPKIEVLFQKSQITARGQQVVLKVQKISGLNAYLYRTDHPTDFLEAAPFYCVVIHEEVWLCMTPNQQKYRLDCAAAAMAVEYNEDEESVSLRLETPDVQTYSSVVSRHPASAMADVQTLIKAFGQPSLFMQNEDDEGDEDPPALSDSEAAANMSEAGREALKAALISGKVNPNSTIKDAKAQMSATA